MLKCELCEKEFKSITIHHLRKNHNIDCKEYIKQFPNAKLIEIKQKPFICYNCDNEFQGKSNQPFGKTPCDKCRELGFRVIKPEGIIEKRLKTYFEKTGYSHPSKNPDVIKKITNGNSNRVKIITCYNCKKDFETCLTFSINTPCDECKKLGFKTPRPKDMAKRCSETYFEKTGYTNPMKNPEVVDRTLNTMNERYGGMGTSSKIIQNKCQETLLNKHGYKHPFQIHEIQEKSKQTSINNHGETSWTKSKEGKVRLSKIRLFTIWGDEESTKNRIESYGVKLVGGYNSYDNCIWECLKCHHQYEALWSVITNGYKCPECFPRKAGISDGEIEVLNYVKSLFQENFEILHGTRRIITPKELDVYIPSLNIAIEYNGLYHHRTMNGRDMFYHLNKTKSCENLGIRLLHFFEDEWYYKQNIIKSTIFRILKLSDNQIDLNIDDIQIKPCIDYSKFLNEYHILGDDNSNVSIGCYYQNELISIMSFINTENNDWILSRFASNPLYNILDIESELLNRFKQLYVWNSISSYSDLRFSHGNLLLNLGFEKIDEIEPQEYIISQTIRIPSSIVNSDEILKQKYSNNDRIHDCGGHIYYFENKI